jgi:hypothetical protein
MQLEKTNSTAAFRLNFEIPTLRKYPTEPAISLFQRSWSWRLTIQPRTIFISSLWAEKKRLSRGSKCMFKSPEVISYLMMPRTQRNLTIF